MGETWNTRRIGMVQMAVAMGVSGTVGWFALGTGLSPARIVFWRCVFAALALAPFALGTLRGLTRTQWRIALGGGVAVVANWLMLFAAIPRASLAVATAVYNVQPFILLALGALFFAERVTRAQLGWLVLAFVGLLCVVGGGADAAYLHGSFAVGVVLALGAATGWAAAAVAARRLAGVPTTGITLIHVLIGCIVLSPFAGLGEPPRDARAWSLLATMGVVHTAGTIALMYAAVQKLPSHLQGILSFINPVAAIAVDIVALGHRLNALQAGGIAVILIAIAGMAITRRPRPAHGAARDG